MEQVEERLTISNPEELKAISDRLSSSLHAGDVVLLEGELGAGKTAFTQMLAATLGVKEKVASPTFTVEARYILEKGVARELIHIDLYRLAPLSPNTEDSLYIQELFANAPTQEQIIVIEWADRLGSIRPPSYWHLLFEHGSQEGTRTVTISRYA
ncbi:MAG: tRNA (adenosine(37)-N6)-threonylcarbamoyltransferase complex ATPase subunit type 1 TsaE [Candidatus Andersenbacteria bacterium]